MTDPGNPDNGYDDDAPLPSVESLTEPQREEYFGVIRNLFTQRGDWERFMPPTRPGEPTPTEVARLTIDQHTLWAAQVPFDRLIIEFGAVGGSPAFALQAERILPLPASLALNEQGEHTPNLPRVFEQQRYIVSMIDTRATSQGFTVGEYAWGALGDDSLPEPLTTKPVLPGGGSVEERAIVSELEPLPIGDLETIWNFLRTYR